MMRFAISLAAAGALATGAQAAEVTLQSAGPVVELTVNETVKSVPDVAQIGAGVVTRAPSAREAVRQNAEAMERVIAQLRRIGIDRKDIQTSNFNLSPQYRYDRENERQIFTGYNCSNNVSVRLRDMERIGEALDALIEAGANNVNGPSFMLEDDMEAKAEARGNAFKRGRQMAENYAAMAGYSGVRLLEVSESVRTFGPIREEIQVMASRAAADAATPIEPGEVGTGVTVHVKYEMTR